MKLVRCGACGSEEPKQYKHWRYPRTWQFKYLKDKPYDLYYCGCENEPEEHWEEL